MDNDGGPISTVVSRKSALVGAVGDDCCLKTVSVQHEDSSNHSLQLSCNAPIMGWWWWYIGKLEKEIIIPCSSSQWQINKESQYRADPWLANEAKGYIIANFLIMQQQQQHMLVERIIGKEHLKFMFLVHCIAGEEWCTNIIQAIFLDPLVSRLDKVMRRHWSINVT